MRDQVFVLGKRFIRGCNDVKKFVGLTLGVDNFDAIIRWRVAGGDDWTFVLGDEVAEADYTSLGHLCGEAWV